MNNEFKAKNYKDATVYVLESASSGGTSSGSVASVSSPMGGVRKRGDNLIAQEGNKDKVPATTPRNFVAKNAKTGGAGAHKDKKKAEKQGDVKHRKPFAESQIDEIFNPTGMISGIVRWAVNNPAIATGIGVLAGGGILASTGGMAALGPLITAATSVTAGQGAVGLLTLDKLKELIQSDPSQAEGWFKQQIYKYIGDEADAKEFEILHAKTAYLGKDQMFRWRAKEWPVTMKHGEAEAFLEKADKYWLDSEKQKALDAEKANQPTATTGEPNQMKANELEEAGYGRNRGYTQGFASPTAPRLGGGREDDEYHNGGDDNVSYTMYFYNTDDGRLKQKKISGYNYDGAKSDGWRANQVDALKVHGIIRSKFDPKKWVQNQGGKWIQVFPFGQLDVAETAAPKTDDAYLAYLAQRKAKTQQPQQDVEEDHSDMGKGWGQASQATAYRSSALAGAGHDDRVRENGHPDEKEDKALIRKMVKQKALKQEDSYMAELSAKLAEKIPANAPVDRWIKDFDKASKTPNAKGHHQFKNKNKDKVRQMAIAASYGAKNPKKKK